MRRCSFIVLGFVVVLAVVLMLAPTVSSRSSNPCGQCHGNKRYSQYLDLLEGNAANQIPTSINVGETKTVSVAIENIVNAPKYTTLSSVTVTLRSQNGRFSVSVPNFNVGSMPTGTKVASWQITGVSAGADSLLITASANNVHMQISYADSYSPSPSINVAASAPPPTPPPPPAPTSYTVTVQSSPNGTSSPASGVYSYTSGSSASFTATPKSGYKFGYWLVNGETHAVNPVTLTISSDMTVTPVFTLEAEPPPPPPTSFMMTIQSSPNGTTVPSAGSYSHVAGENVTLNAVVNAGYEFDYWLVNGAVETTNPLVLTVTNDVTIGPVFSALAVSPADPAQEPSDNQTSNGSVSDLVISIVSPLEGEKWQIGTAQDIAWNIDGSTGLFNFTIEYSIDGYDGPWTIIGTNITYNGDLAWTVPSAPATYYIRANVTDSASPPQTVATMIVIEVTKATVATSFPAYQRIMLLAILVLFVLILIARITVADRTGASWRKVR